MRWPASVRLSSGTSRSIRMLCWARQPSNKASLKQCLFKPQCKSPTCETQRKLNDKTQVWMHQKKLYGKSYSGSGCSNVSLWLKSNRAMSFWETKRSRGVLEPCAQWRHSTEMRRLTLKLWLGCLTALGRAAQKKTVMTASTWELKQIYKRWKTYTLTNTSYLNR